jgi:hypothetical protein
MIILFDQIFDMPHLAGGCILGKGEMLTDGDVNKFVHTI